MQHSTHYDGNKTFVHTVKSGETLSSIAARYGFKSWEPIWRFNTDVKPVLSGNPNQIRAGATLFIPRSEAGYNYLIKKMKVLQLRLQNSLETDLYQLESDYYVFKANEVAVDFVGDVLTTLVSIGFQAKKASEVASAAEKVVGRERVAAEYLARKEGEKLRDMLGDEFAETLADAAVERSTDRMTDKNREGARHFYHAVKSGRKIMKAVQTFSMQGGKSLLDASDIVLEYIKPSTLASAWLAHTVGQAPEQSYEAARRRIEKEITNSTAQLYDKIERIQDERDLLYQPSIAPTQLIQ